MNYLSDKGYVAIGVQTDENTAVKPNVFLPFIEEDLSTDLNNERVKQIVGIEWKSNLILQGQRKHGGKIKILCDPDNIGHLLNMAMKIGSSTGSGSVGYTHPFTVDTPNYYTIEVLKGNAVHRYVGCRIDKLVFSFENGNLIAEAEIVAKYKFNYGTLKTALTGAGMVAVVFDEQYDPEPCFGLVATDVIQVWEAGVATDVTVATIVAGNKSITMSATAITATAGALITLKGQTPSYATIKRPFKLGQCLVGFGADDTAALANVASYVLATALDDFKLTIERGTVQRNASGKNDPLVITGIGDAELTTKKLFENAADLQQYNDIAKKACVIKFTGDNIATTYYSSLTITLYNIKAKKADNKIKSGEYVYDETDYFVEYDNGDAKAIEISLINSTAGASY